MRPVSFIAQICLETRRDWLRSQNSEYSKGYSELREPIKTRKNCYSLIWKLLNRYIEKGNKIELEMKLSIAVIVYNRLVFDCRQSHGQVVMDMTMISQLISVV